MQPEGLSMKNSSDTIGNRTRDLPACSALPQPTAPRRTTAWSENPFAMNMFWGFFIIILDKSSSDIIVVHFCVVTVTTEALIIWWDGFSRSLLL